MRKILIILLLFNFANIAYAQEYTYILSETMLKTLHIQAENFFKNSHINVFKDVRGIIITFPIENIFAEYLQLSDKTLQDLEKIEYFLAKIKNPVIIEVHTTKFPQDSYSNLKNWEISTVIANKIETILSGYGKISQAQIKSIGYGEFMPSKNTSYNGVKNMGRVDIIILCSINGE